QQAIRSEVVGEIELRKQIAVQISRARTKSPAMLDLDRKDVFHLLKADRGVLSRGALFPEKKVFGSALERPRFGVVHDFRAGGGGVQNARAVLEIVPDDEIGMAITINISEEAGIGKPAFLTRNQFLGKVIFCTQASGPSGRPLFPEKRDRRTAPVINNDV